jgi:hypothetical protein
MENPTLVERRRPSAVVGRWLGDAASAIAVRPWLAAVTFGLLFFSFELVMRLLVEGTKDEGPPIGPLVVVAAIAGVAHAFGARRRFAEGPHGHLTHLSRTERLDVVRAVRRGDDVGDDRLAPALLLFARADELGPDGLVPGPVRALIASVFCVVALTALAARAGGAAAAIAMFVLSASLVVAGLVKHRSRGDRRRRAVALAEPRASRWWDERAEAARPGNVVLRHEHQPTPPTTFGAWDDTPLWSVLKNEERDILSP